MGLTRCYKTEVFYIYYTSKTAKINFINSGAVDIIRKFMKLILPFYMCHERWALHVVIKRMVTFIVVLSAYYIDVVAGRVGRSEPKRRSIVLFPANICTNVHLALLVLFASKRKCKLRIKMHR